MRLETERLILHPMTLAELKSAAKDLTLVTRPLGVSLPHIGFWERQGKRRICKVKSGLVAQNPRAWLLSTSWLVIRREGFCMVGEAGLKGPPTERYTVEIGYGAPESCRNRGYMTEAIGALTRFALFQKEYCVERVTALTLPGNIASHRVLEKNRYTRQPSYGKYWLWERVKYPEDKTERGYIL
ncbi:MAG: GNAT family N-acetyltransferase [Oscillospiraceae bacterium]|nr:GNAT family N-acetyltransferase [Oscillospiraceae bacterium]